MSQQFVEELCSSSGVSDGLIDEIERVFSADKVIRNQYAALMKRIGQEIAALKALEIKLTDAQGAAARRKDLQTERDNAYGRAFEAIICEQDALAELYAPLSFSSDNSLSQWPNSQIS